MLARLAEYNQGDTLRVDRLDFQFVEGFAHYLASQAVTPSTTKLFMMSLRAVLRSYCAPDYKPLVNSLFANLGSHNDTLPVSLGFEQLRSIIALDLDDKSPLWKARALFLYSVYGAAMPLAEIAGDVAPKLPHLRRLQSDYQSRYNTTLTAYAAAISPDAYHRLLDAIGHLARLPRPLTAHSAADAWIATARRLSLPIDLIVSSLRVMPPGYPAPQSTYSRAEINQARELVANAISDETPRWYVMKCNRQSATELAGTLSRLLPSTEHLRTFVAPPAQTAPGERAATRPTDSLLFVECTIANVHSLRRQLSPAVYLYTLAGTNRPAPIAAHEMRLFMVLCDLSSGYISYYFPGDQDTVDSENELATGTTAEIISGAYSGHVGIVKRLRGDRYRVQITFTTIGGLRVTATVPATSIRPR